ncbi:MAG: DNA polymerase III subunit delta [Acidimicrobiales bacterium]
MTPPRSAPADPHAFLVRGDDPALVAQEARSLIDRLVGEREPSLVVEEHGTSGEDLDVRAVVDACLTPPFLGDRRVIVVRDAGRIGTSEAAALVSVVADLPGTAYLVVVAGGGTVPPALVKAISAAGQQLDASVGTGRERSSWVADHLREAPLRFDAAARSKLQSHLGDDLGRLAGLVDSLVAAYGEHAAISVAELDPFLGSAGSVPPWELTDAIDSGSIPAALSALRRMLEAGGRQPTEVIGILHRHFANMLRLDGVVGIDSAEAARLLGVRSPFVAKKAMEQGRRLGGERVAQAITLLADADLDVKGRTALPPDLVLEVLVARLSRQLRARPMARQS